MNRLPAFSFTRYSRGSNSGRCGQWIGRSCACGRGVATRQTHQAIADE